MASEAEERVIRAALRWWSCNRDERAAAAEELLKASASLGTIDRPDLETKLRIPSAPRYYLRSGVTGDCVLFWRKEDAGYTMDLRDAALYSLADAERRVRPGIDFLVEERDALQALRFHVDFERLPRPICFKCGQPIAAYMHYYVEAEGKRHATPENCKPPTGEGG